MTINSGKPAPQEEGAAFAELARFPRYRAERPWNRDGRRLPQDNQLWQVSASPRMACENQLFGGSREGHEREGSRRAAREPRTAVLVGIQGKLVSLGEGPLHSTDAARFEEVSTFKPDLDHYL